LVALLAVLAAGRVAAADDCAYPRMLVVLDKSSSMLRTLASGQSIWQAARSALEQVLQAHQDAIHFGLMVFPMPNQCGPGQVVVDVGLNPAATFSPYLADAPPTTGNYTPLKQTLDAVATYQPLQADPTRESYVLLITDGEQWCSEADSGVYDRTVAPRVSTLRSLGIKTYVIGLSASVNRCMLGDMAVRGGTALPGCDWDHTVNGCQPDRAVRCYYQADDPATLNAALTEIARQVSAEVCDGVDNDCDGQVDGMARGCATRCEAGQEVCLGGVWGACDARIPSAEVCDGVDNDCDGTTDGMTRTCQTLCGDGVETCVRGTWGGCTAPQPGVETCDNLIDEDCDGQTDEDCGDCVNGDTRPCGRDEGACQSGIQTCIDHAWGPCEGEIGPAIETCNNADDDCDGATDEGLWRSCANACGEGTERCTAGAWGGCDAPQPATEVCNDIDDDCDGRTDEDLTRSCQGACGAGEQTCDGGRWQDCDAPAPAPEFCNGLDDDCDGKVDQGDQLCPVGLLCIDGVCAPDPNAGGEDAGDGGSIDAGDGGGGEPDVVAPVRPDTVEVTGEYSGQGRMVSGVGGAVGCQAGGPVVPATGLLLLLPLLALLGRRAARRRA
jgi:hypothetical protein